MALGLVVLVVAIPALLLFKLPGGAQHPPLRLPRAAPWLILGLVLHVLWVYGFSRSHVLPGWLLWLPVAADGPIAVFLLANRRVPGVLIILFGLALNAAAMIANGGLMPITMANVPGPHTPQRFAGDRLLLSPDRVVGPDAPLRLLGDVLFIGMRGGVSATVSVGDLIILGGSVVVVVRFARLGMAVHDKGGSVTSAGAISSAD